MARCCKGHALLLRIIAKLFFIAAIVFSILAATSCEFLKRGSVSFGLFKFGTDECEDYREGFSHGWLHSWAAVCAVLAPIFGGIVIALMLLDFCFKMCCRTTIQSLLISFAEMSQVCTFLMYASDICITRSDGGNQFESALYGESWEGCKMGRGSIYSIISFGCFVIGGCFRFCGPKFKPIFCQKDGNNGSGGKKSGDEEAVFQGEENPAEKSDDPDSTRDEAKQEEEAKEEEGVKPQLY